MINTEKLVRLALYKHDLRLVKNRAHSISRQWFGVGYMIVDNQNNVVNGANARAFEASLEDVAGYLNSL